jgi:ABC-type glycerol-3-phosphate transport system substrate-binding protein
MDVPRRSRWMTAASTAAAGLLLACCSAGASAEGAMTLLHGITGPDEQAALQAVIDAFTEETGTPVQVEVGQAWQLLTAGAFITMTVPMIVFFSLQRYFVRGLTAGSVKG